MATKCPQCKHDNPEDTRFCGNCAAPLKPDKDIPVSPTKTLQTPIKEFSKGSTIGSKYEVIEELGRGGMGVVYKAKDTKLKRTVALKFLSPELTRDEEAKERFIHEAQTASALDHPNICTVHEIDEDEGQMFIAMAYIEGQSLREKAKAGPLKLNEALDIAIQVAQGMHEAHEKGVVHRDIKSANIMVTAKGQAKIMDFGVAKLAGQTRFTRTGTTMGTVAYMSPEQTRAEKVDYRTDIWSLGVVIYEMVTGQLPFKGDYEQAVVYSILNEEPESLTSVRTGVPMELERIVNKALIKDPAARYQHVDELAVDLRAVDVDKVGISKISTPGVRAQAPRQFVRLKEVKQLGIATLIVIITALVTFVAVWNLKPGATKKPQTVRRLIINLKSNERLGGTVYGNDLAISPDGKQLVYVASDGNVIQLYHRPMDQLDATSLPGTEGAEHPFFSPDSRWVGFFLTGELKKLRLGSARPQTICKGGAIPQGATWSPDGSIIFSVLNSGLLHVSASGGIPKAITTPDVEKDEIGHRFPVMLPGGKAVLFHIDRGGWLQDTRVAVLSLRTKKWQVILEEEGYYPHYVSTGHILYVQAGMPMAVPFDLRRLKISGTPLPILEDVAVGEEGKINFSFSRDGTLVYASRRSEEENINLVWVNRRGQITVTEKEQRLYSHPRISPDGKKVAVNIERDLHVYDVESGTLNKITFKKTITYPVWTPDGKHLVFAADWGGKLDLYWKLADGSAEAEKLFSSEYPIYPASWSPNGESLAFYEINPNTQRDIWILSIKNRTAKPIIASQFNERVPMFSPDGRFISYVSNDSGRDEIYVQPFSITGAKWQISEGGGTEPMWSPDGRELFYRAGNKMMSVKVETEPSFKWGKPQKLFEGRFLSHLNFSNYHIHPDGDRFLMAKAKEKTSINQIHVVLNWFEELKRLVPTEK